MAGIESRCPECSGVVQPAGGTEYRCRDCGEAFDSADIFLP